MVLLMIQHKSDFIENKIKTKKMNKDILTISFAMQKNGQTYLKNQVYLKNQAFASQVLKSMCDHFSTLRKKGLNYNIQEHFN